MVAASEGEFREKASNLEKGISLGNEKWKDRRSRRKIQKRELRRILTFFMWANAIAGVAIFFVWLIEHFDPAKQAVITDKVVMAYLAGITVQSGAIILAAFKGLFTENETSAANTPSTDANRLPIAAVDNPNTIGSGFSS